MGILRTLSEVKKEYDRATAKFPAFHNAHEGYAVLKEEVDEMWDAIKKNDVEEARAEAVQVAAMVVRFLMDVESEASDAD